MFFNQSLHIYVYINNNHLNEDEDIDKINFYNNKKVE